jgi:DNA-binding NarL/FixJ family response regulator
MSISIVLVDDHPIMRNGLRASLATAAEFQIVAETGDGLDAVRLAEQQQPDVLILDLMLPGLGGLDVLPIVRVRSPKTRVVVFSMLAAEEYVLTALRHGAMGYVLKGCTATQLEEAVRRAAEGLRYLSPEISDRALDAYHEKATASLPTPHDMLTPREREVFQLTAEGNGCAEVALRLSISRRTAEMHRASAMRKLGLKTQADVARYAMRRKMIPGYE